MRILFCNIGWMRKYNGMDGDILERGGSYNDNEIGHEVCNFTNMDGSVFGYVQSPGKINITKLGANKDDLYIDGVTVVWTASSKSNGTVIVGWYKNATVYKEEIYFEFASELHKQNGVKSYRIKADFEDAYLLPIDEREFGIPRAKKGGIGQSNVWYAKLEETKPLVEKVKKYIEKYCLVNDLPDIDDLGVTEGSLKIRRHLVRERNLSIIKQKKQKILSDFGKLECEVCHFDFEKNYGEIGKEFCEVHHLIPLNQSDSIVKTNLEDLAIVCSNCHRMLHKGQPLLEIHELKMLLNKVN
ncbi:HNH endonuclease [Acinetobacter genomosp. 33YU]|uniref:HNH endonuclease n=1 Tax=Acinetobacter seifertii TaxID=1530123 RepID=UPI00097FA4DB|nr:HNH endonuclease [Acinetobacter genomosp. 33YU]PJG65713.1 HNH endonuclease [Acinetobacter seifertii]